MTVGPFRAHSVSRWTSAQPWLIHSVSSASDQNCATGSSMRLRTLESASVSVAAMASDYSRPHEETPTVWAWVRWAQPMEHEWRFGAAAELPVAEIRTVMSSLA